jgi:hypothetical protein
MNDFCFQNHTQNLMILQVGAVWLGKGQKNKTVVVTEEHEG